MNRILGLAFHPEYFSLVAANETQIESLAVLELSRPFDLKSLRDGNWALHYYIETLTALYEKIGESGKQVNIVLDSSMALIKKIPIAMGLEEDMIKDQMQWEAEQLLISPLEQYNLVYERLPFAVPTGNPIYLQVLVRKKVIETVRKIVSEIGLQISEIDIDYFSIIRCLLYNYALAPKGLGVIIDLHREFIGLVFIRKQEYFLSNKLFLQDNSENTAELVKAVLKDLRRIVFGHGLGKGIEDINHFFILDHVSNKEFIEEFGRTVNVPVDAIQPFRKLSITSDLSQSTEYTLLPERFTTSLGLVLKKNPTLTK